MKQQIKKRATSAIPIIAYEKEDIEPLVEELVEIIETTNWDYKSEFRDFFRMRDKALVSLLLLSGLRISEALELKFAQVREQPKSFLLLSVVTKKRCYVREKIVMPKDGSLGGICVYFEKWFRYLNEQNKTEWLFPSGCAFGIIYSKNLPA
jgi:site-specific recombinase XerD